MSEETSTSPVYRIYRIDVDGVFIDAEIIEASNDLEAISLAQNKVDGSPIELWDRDRLMARLGPQSPS